jgi:hypothetical protein
LWKLGFTGSYPTKAQTDAPFKSDEAAPEGDRLAQLGQIVIVRG